MSLSALRACPRSSFRRLIVVRSSIVVILVVVRSIVIDYQYDISPRQIMPPPPKKRTAQSSPAIPLLELSPSSQSSNVSSLQGAPSPRKRKESLKKNNSIVLELVPLQTKAVRSAAAATTTQQLRISSNARDDRIIHGPAFASSLGALCEDNLRQHQTEAAVLTNKAAQATVVSASKELTPAVNCPIIDLQSSGSDGDDNDDASSSNELIPPPQTENDMREQERVERAIFVKVRKLLVARSSKKNGASEDLPYWRKNILQPLMDHKAELLHKTKVVDDIMLAGCNSRQNTSKGFQRRDCRHLFASMESSRYGYLSKDCWCQVE